MKLNKFNLFLKKTLIILLVIILSGCSIFIYENGLKFDNHKYYNLSTSTITPQLDIINLKNNDKIVFYRSIGECGASISFFTILLPLIPVNFNFNTCEENFYLKIDSPKLYNISIKYNEVIKDGEKIKSIFYSKEELDTNFKRIGKIYYKGLDDKSKFSDLKEKVDSDEFYIKIGERSLRRIAPSYYEISYIFKIENFKEFKKAKDKKLILTTEDGFKQEIPVKWGIMRNHNWWPN